MVIGIQKSKSDKPNQNQNIIHVISNETRLFPLMSAASVYKTWIMLLQNKLNTHPRAQPDPNTRLHSCVRQSALPKQFK